MLSVYRQCIVVLPQTTVHNGDSSLQHSLLKQVGTRLSAGCTMYVGVYRPAPPIYQIAKMLIGTELLRAAAQMVFAIKSA